MKEKKTISGHFFELVWNIRLLFLKMNLLRSFEHLSFRKEPSVSLDMALKADGRQFQGI